LLSLELALFGIKATCIHSEPFRTDFLDAISVIFGDVINDRFWHKADHYKFSDAGGNRDFFRLSTCNATYRTLQS